MLTYTREMGYIEHNPAHGVRKPADKRRSFRLAPKDYRALGQTIEAAERRGEHWQATTAIRLLALTGCRRSEILNLRWSEVDVKNRCLRLGDTKTGASVRPLTSPVWAILAGRRCQGDYVFPGVSRSDRSFASIFSKTWRRIVGTQYSPHYLRHAYAFAAHELGLGELTIKALLGHARAGVTGGYIAPMDSLMLAAEKVARSIDGAMRGKTWNVVRPSKLVFRTVKSTTSDRQANDGTFFIEDGQELPRRYTPAELETLAKAAGVEKFSPATVEKLQQAVEEFQWAMSGDPGGIFFRSNKEKRYRLKRILKLCAAQRPSKKIELALRGLDGHTSQRLGRVRVGHPRLLTAIRRVLKKIPSRGPDPERSHRQFIDDLARIFPYATEQRPGRRVRKQEYNRFGATTLKDYGPFLAFVKAAVEPLDATRCCEADIKAALHQRKRASRKRKNTAAAKR